MAAEWLLSCHQISPFFPLPVSAFPSVHHFPINFSPSNHHHHRPDLISQQWNDHWNGIPFCTSQSNRFSPLPQSVLSPSLPSSDHHFRFPLILIAYINRLFQLAGPHAEIGLLSSSHIMNRPLISIKIPTHLIIPIKGQTKLITIMATGRLVSNVYAIPNRLGWFSQARIRFFRFSGFFLGRPNKLRERKLFEEKVNSMIYLFFSILKILTRKRITIKFESKICKYHIRFYELKNLFLGKPRKRLILGIFYIF